MIRLADDTPALLRAQDMMIARHYNAGVDRARRAFADYSNLSLVQALLDRRDDIDQTLDSLTHRVSSAQRGLLLQRLTECIAAQDVCVWSLHDNGVTEIHEWLTE